MQNIKTNRVNLFKVLIKTTEIDLSLFSEAYIKIINFWGLKENESKIAQFKIKAPKLNKVYDTKVKNKIFKGWYC